MLGVVNLDKPVGPTSHDMVGLMRRLTGTRRIGHAGTLDPLASGVLPILVGAATRFSQELTGGPKRYDAVVRLGFRSSTDDAEGPLEAVDGPLPSPAAISAALRRFVGTYEQRPPAFSARKVAGRPAHRAARSGVALDVPPRQVTVHAVGLIAITDGEGWADVRIDVRCGPGTYVRALARDLGEALGCGGYLAALRRTEAAGLRADEALLPEALERLASEGRLQSAIHPIAPLLSMPSLRLSDDDAARFVHGSTVRAASPDALDGRYAVFCDEQLLGIGTMEGAVLQPEKVIAAGEAE
jgi:tRNA pseudouridine55 synthase